MFSFSKVIDRFDTTTDFILLIFPDARKPVTINDDLHKALSQTSVDIHDNPCPPLWDHQNRILRVPARYSKSNLADWLLKLAEKRKMTRLKAE